MSARSFNALIDIQKDESTIQKWSSVIGIVTAIVGNILISFALNIQKYAHIRLSREREQRQSKSVGDEDGEDSRAYDGRGDEYDTQNGRQGDQEDGSNGADQRSRAHHKSLSSSSTARDEKDNDEAENKTYLQSPYWWAGICLMTVGEAGNFLAYGFAQASIVSPLGVVALISNCIIAPFMLKERFRQRDFWGVMIAVAGAVIVVLSARSSETKFGPHAIWDAISRWEFELYLGITMALIGGLVWASSKKYGEKTILVDLVLVGLFGGYTVLATKGISSLLSYTFWRVITFPVFYLLLAILIVTAMLQIKYLNKALQRFDSTQVIPTQFVLFTLSVIIGSAILYRDFKSATASQIAKFVAGCALTFAGVYFITSGRRQGEDSKNTEDDEGSDEEATIGLELEQEHQEDDISKLSGRHSQSRGSTEDRLSRFPSMRSSQMGSSSIPRTPRRYPSDPSDAPSIIVTQQREGDQEESPTESSPLLQKQIRISGGGPPGSSDMRPSLQSTISSPAPLSGSTPGDTASPVPEAPDRLAQLPATPDRRSSLQRSSIARILPGPLFSPLSSSLSGVIADSLRRGLDVSPISRRGAGSLRHPRARNLMPQLRKSKSLRVSGDPSQFSHEDDVSATPSRRAQNVSDPATAEGQRPSHRRSFSTAVGDFFRFKDRRRNSDAS